MTAMSKPPRVPPPSPLRYISQSTNDAKSRRVAAMAGAMAGYAAAGQAYDAGHQQAPAAPPTAPPSPGGGMGGPPALPGLPPPPAGLMPQTAPSPTGGLPVGLGSPPPGMGGGASSPVLPPPVPGRPIPPPGSPTGGGAGAIPLARGGPVPAVPPPPAPTAPDLGGTGGGMGGPDDSAGMAQMMQQFMDRQGTGPSTTGQGAPAPVSAPPPAGTGGNGMVLNGAETGDTGQSLPGSGETAPAPAPQEFVAWLGGPAKADPSPFAQDLVRLYSRNPDMADDLWGMVLALAAIGDPEVPATLTKMAGLPDTGNPPPPIPAGNGLGPPSTSQPTLAALSAGPPPVPGATMPPMARGGRR